MSKMEKKEMQKMMEMAIEAMEHAYVPYSHFKVGACLKSKQGRYYLGCNIENAAYSVTNCAERTALFKAVYEGEREFDGIAVACSGDYPAYPCGACRQALSEFCDKDFLVITQDIYKDIQYCTLEDMLPFVFDKEALN